MPKKHKFPDANDYGLKNPAVLCPGDRVLTLYNENGGRTAKRISKRVKAWFTAEAHEHGWVGVRFLPEVQTRHSGGAILWQAPKVSVNVTKNTLVLVERSDDAGEEGDED
ncbi:MAG: hypothetical protein IPG45_16185 [Deltaproteobacteria bacterium]|nr:hypothetical protein [Deltaproteobacteria bacterium]